MSSNSFVMMSSLRSLGSGINKIVLRDSFGGIGGQHSGSSIPTSIPYPTHPLIEFIKVASLSGLRQYTQDIADEGVVKPEIGAGTDYIVHLAKDHDGNLVVVKRVKAMIGVASLSGSASSEERVRIRKVLHEIKIESLPSLRDCQNILKLLGFGWELSENSLTTPFLVVEYAEHGTLRNYLKHPPGPRHSLSTKVKLCLDVANGLLALHSIGVAHGDMKLENALVCNTASGDAIAKLADFGYSKVLDGGGTLEYWGTKEYLPPEILAQTGGAETAAFVDARMYRACDIYAYGLMVWEVILDGRTFFGHENRALVGVDALLARALDSTSQLLAADTIEGKQVQKILEGCLQPSPLDRLSIEEIAVVLTTNQDNGITLNLSAPVAAADPAHTDDTVGIATINNLLTMYSGYSTESESPQVAPWTVQTAIAQGLRDQTAHPNPKISSQACLEVAMCHYIGFGVPRDLAKVLEYTDEAAAKGSFQARRVRRRFYDAFSQPCDPLAIEVPLDDQEERQILALEEVEAQYRPFSPFRTVDDINQECFRAMSCSSSLTLHEAAYMGDLGLLRDRLENTGDHRDDSGRTALFLSCQGGHLEAMKLLLENGSDPTIPDEDGHAVLHMLIMFDVQEVEYALSSLLQFRPDLDLNPYSSQVLDASEHWCELWGTPLHWAVLSANKELVKTLVQQGAKVDGWPRDECPIRLAASLHLAEIIEILVGGLPPKYELSGESPFFALDESNPMRRLLIHGKNYREAIKKTVSVLSRTWPVIDSGLSSWNGNPLRKILVLNISHADRYIARALTEFGAGNDVYDGCTLTQTAILGCHGSPLPSMDEMALDMLELQPSAISTRSTDFRPGWTALHWAAAGGITTVVAKILELAPNGINQRTADEEARTALHLAAESGKSPETIRLLLSHGADPALQTVGLKLTPLGTFLSNQRSKLNDEVLGLLLDASAFNGYLALGSNAWNVLHYAVGRAAVLDTEALPGHLLLRQLADTHPAVRTLISATTAQGWQPLHLAAYFVDAVSIAVLVTEYSADVTAYTESAAPARPFDIVLERAR